MNLIRRTNHRDFPGYLDLFNELFDNSLPKFYSNQSRNCTCNIPSVNISENESDFQIDFAAPGYAKEEFKIEVQKNVLTVKVEKEEENEGNSRKVSCKEYHLSSFERNFNLPENIDLEKIDAKYENGILQVSLPKKELAPENDTFNIAVN